jgi:hypothetical protein
MQNNILSTNVRKLDTSYCLKKSRDSSVGTALVYGLDDRGSRVRFPVGAGNFSFATASRTALEPTQTPIRWVKWPGREDDHSSSSSAEIKELVELYLHSPIRFHGVVLS